MLPIIALDIVEAPKSYREYYAMVVKECIELREQRRHSIQFLAEELAFSRQRLSKLEKLEVHDIAMTAIILEYYFKELKFSIQ